MAKSATKPRQMIVGTEGNSDYLVIARQNGYVLGIKALLQIGPDGSMYGFRLRMQKADLDPEEKIAELPAKEKETMVQTFKKVPWGKRSLTRFSTVVTVPSSFGYDFRSELIEESTGKVHELITEIEDMIDPAKLINKADCLAFLNEEYNRIFDLVEEHFNKKKAPEKSADIVQFGVKESEHDIE